MRRRSLASFVAALLVPGVLFASGIALADERTEARSHFKKGMTSISNGRYEEGIDELKRAYDILPHPNVLYNIARAYVDMGDLENAVTYYKKYLEGNPKDRDEVQKVVENLEARIRRQQAKLAESQGPAPTGPGAGQPGATGPGPGPGAPGPGPATGPGVAPGGPTGPGVGPGPAPTGPGAGAAGPTGPGVEPPVPAGGGVKTEDVFAETVVTASKGEQSPLDAPNSTSIITQQDVRLNGKTEIAELFRRLAGVDMMETTGAQTEVSLRGFNQRLSNKVLVLVDGRSVFVDLIGATFWETLTISPDDIDHIEVVRGPGSALYGADAVNGVINIITKKPGEGRSGFTAGFGTNAETHGAVWAVGRDKDFAYRASAGYDYLPRWSREAPGQRADIHVFQPDQNASGRSEHFDLRTTQTLGKDVTVGIGGGFNKIDTMEILAIGPVNDFILQGQSSDVTGFFRSKHLEARVFWNNFNVTHGNNAAYVGQSILPGRANVDIIDGEVAYVAQFETGANINHDLHLGVGYRYKGVQWSYQDKDRHLSYESAYLHDEIKLGERFAVIGDYRVDHDAYLDKLVQSPRGSVLFHPTKQSTIRAIVATAFRSPTMLEGYLGIPVPLPVAGGELISSGIRPDNPNFKLSPEQVFTTEVGYITQDSDLVTFDSAFFYNHMQNIIELAPNRPLTTYEVGQGLGRVDAVTGAYPLFFGGFENQCQTYNMYGAELGARTYPAEGLDLFATYTLNYVKQDNSGCTEEQKALIVSDKRTSLHKFHIGGQVRTKAGLDVELVFHYYSPQDWAEQITNVEKQRIEYQSFHLDQYYTMNMTVTYRFLQNRANLSFVAFNVLDNEHREHPFGQLVQRKMMGFLGYQF